MLGHSPLRQVGPSDLNYSPTEPVSSVQFVNGSSFCLRQWPRILETPNTWNMCTLMENSEIQKPGFLDKTPSFSDVPTFLAVLGSQITQAWAEGCIWMQSFPSVRTFDLPFVWILPQCVGVGGPCCFAKAREHCKSLEVERWQRNGREMAHETQLPRQRDARNALPTVCKELPSESPSELPSKLL